MEEIILKLKHFEISRIRILHRHDVMPIESTEQSELEDVETLITHAFNQLDATDIM